MSPSRRDFLRGAGILAGSLFLPGCGGSGGGGRNVANGSLPLFPAGYRFVPLIEIGDSLPQGDGRIADFSGIMVIHDDREVVFNAENENGLIGLYRATFDPDPFARTHLRELSKIVREGDVLSDGSTVTRINQFVANRHHTVAAILETNDPSISEPSAATLNRLYIGPEGGPLQRLLVPVEQTPGGAGRLGLDFYDLDLHEDDDLLLISTYSNDGDIQVNQGLFFLPGASIDAGSMLLSTAQFLPDSGGVIAGLGLCDLSGDGHFVCQAVEQSRTGGAVQSTVSGRTTDSKALRLRSAPKGTVLSRAVQAQGSVALGEAVMGPRIDSRGTVAQVLNTSEDSVALVYGGKTLFEASGELSGFAMKTMWPPVASDTGLVFLLTDTEEGQKLLASDGATTRTYLKEGDEIEGRVLNDMIFGTMPKSVDALGNLVLHGEFLDDSVALVLGMPV